MLIIVGRPLPIIISSFTANLIFSSFVSLFLVLVSCIEFSRPFLFNFNYIPWQNRHKEEAVSSFWQQNRFLTAISETNLFKKINVIIVYALM
jgi:hypothetical protein